MSYSLDENASILRANADRPNASKAHWLSVSWVMLTTSNGSNKTIEPNSCNEEVELRCLYCPNTDVNDIGANQSGVYRGGWIV